MLCLFLPLACLYILYCLNFFVLILRTCYVSTFARISISVFSSPSVFSNILRSSARRNSFVCTAFNCLHLINMFLHFPLILRPISSIKAIKNPKYTVYLKPLSCVSVNSHCVYLHIPYKSSFVVNPSVLQNCGYFRSGGSVKRFLEIAR